MQKTAHSYEYYETDSVSSGQLVPGRYGQHYEYWWIWALGFIYTRYYLVQINGKFVCLSYFLLIYVDKKEPSFYRHYLYL